MAIVQISRITNRQGLLTDLPQPLAGAELGWALDQRRLFIGNGAVDEGAPIVGNTEILTQFSDLVNIPNQYTYKGQAGGYLIQTGSTSGNPVSQSIQSRLDSYAVATDFGIVGDGVTDNTAAINRAMFQLYCREGTPTAARRSLFFPAGNYVITGTLYIPTWANLYGEGSDSTIISLVTQEWVNDQSYQANTVVVYEGDWYQSLVAVPIGTSLNDPDYWQPTSAPEYIWRTADSNQNYSTSIGAAAGVPPSNIVIRDMRFTCDSQINGVLIQDATDSTFTNVAFQGPLSKSIIAAAVTADLLPDTAAVRWASTPIWVCKNVNFVNCTFTGFAYGTKTDQQVATSSITGSTFDSLYQAVVLGSSAPVLGGPSGIRILDNVFDNVYAEGVVFQEVSLNATGYNTFYDVGNAFNGPDNPVTPIIDIDAENNVSIGDMFARTNAVVESSGIPRITLNQRLNVALDNAYQLQLGSYHRNSGVKMLLNDAQTDIVLFTFNANEIKTVSFDYTIVRGLAIRTGKYTIVASTDGNNAGMIWNDTGSENSDTGVTFTTTELLGTITVTYTTTAIAVDADLYYSLTRLA